MLNYIINFLSLYVQVWAVLKPGFLALLADPFDTQPLDIIVFDVLPASDGNGDGRLSLASEMKERNPLRHSFKVRWVLFYLHCCFIVMCFKIMPIHMVFLFVLHHILSKSPIWSFKIFQNINWVFERSVTSNWSSNGNIWSMISIWSQ